MKREVKAIKAVTAIQKVSQLKHILNDLIFLVTP
jgi:hypothetical protein